MSYPAPPPDASTARLSAQLEGVGREIRELRRGTEDRLKRIEHQTTRTNGRVDALELASARAEGAAEALASAASATLRRVQIFTALAGVLLAAVLGVLGLILTHAG